MINQVLCDDNDTCRSCGVGMWLLTREGDRVCEHCGMCDNSYQALYTTMDFEDSPKYSTVPRKINWKNIPTYIRRAALSTGGTRGRYRPKFHYNERIAQWLMGEPEVPEDAWKRLVEEAKTGKYGPPRDFTRATISMITRACGLQKYRERWKTILKRFGSHYQFAPEPHNSLVDWLETYFQHTVNAFHQFKDEMPRSVFREKNGKVRTRQRHNVLNYNYIHRKLLEARGVYDYHTEFPVPRSVNKLHTLDRIMEKICQRIEIKFRRSVVIKRPKLSQNFLSKRAS